MRRRNFMLGLTAATTAACALDRRLKANPYFQPTDLVDDWPIGAPEDLGVDPEAVADAYARFFSEDEFLLSRGFLVVRRGVLIAEGYARTMRDRDRLQHVKSVTKSVTSLLVGQAIARGVLPGLDAPLGDLLEEAAAVGGDKANITVEQLLTMRSGLDWENSVETGTLMVDEPANSVKFMLSRPLVREPGSETHYSDADLHLAGAVVSRQAGETLEQLARDWLFDPIGVRDLKWEHHRDGIDYGAYGLWLRPRDMARVGELCRTGGTWDGQQVVPPDWIDTSVQPQVDIEEKPYGYSWWIGEPFGGYAADGHGGQYIYVLPDHDLVFVHTAHPYTKTHGHGVVIEEVEDGLIRPIVDGLLD